MTCTCDFVFFSDKTQDFADNIADGEFWREKSGQYMIRRQAQRVQDSTSNNITKPHPCPRKHSTKDASTHLLDWRQSVVFLLP